MGESLNLNGIARPTLLLNEKICRSNIRRMLVKSKGSNTVFRPHFKTHQSLEIGRWFKSYGVDRITVSSVEMAKYFSDEWDDIAIAFPVNLREIEQINQLAAKIRLSLLLESIESADFLAKKLKSEVSCYIKIDVGSNRTGINPENKDKINQILSQIENTPLLSFRGFLSHAGHTYNCRSEEEVGEIFNSVLEILMDLKRYYIHRYPGLIISVGDTPGCSVAEDFSGLDELRPGNFVFYDLMQHMIGSNSPDQIAVALVCPVVAIHEERNEMLIYGGAVHFSKEYLDTEQEGRIYGQVLDISNNHWGEIVPEMYLKHLSQEHGIVSVPESLIEGYKPGDLLAIIPVHSCLTADLASHYMTTDHRIIEKMKS